MKKYKKPTTTNFKPQVNERGFMSSFATGLGTGLFKGNIVDSIDKIAMASKSSSIKISK